MSVYMVTGGAGFIGSNIVHELARQGHQTRVLDDFSSGKEENLEGLEEKIELTRGSVSDLEAVQQASKGVDYILHLAAIPSVARSVEDPASVNQTNVGGTVNILVAARESGVKRVVLASSSSAYGDSPSLPKHEAMTPAPLSPYAVSKLASEYYCQVFTATYGLETVCLRYFNIFGPRQNPGSEYAAVVPIFISRLLNGEPPVIYGDGSQSRDFTFVDNAVQATIAAAIAPSASGHVINVACGERYSLKDLLRELGSIINCNVEPLMSPPRPGDIKHSLGDISRAQTLLGYKPAVSFREGLERTVRWYRQRARALCGD